MSAFLRDIGRRQRAALYRFGVRVVTDVITEDEPVQLADAYAHLRIDADSFGSIDDTWLLAMIPAAREYCERYKGRSFATRTMELGASAFPTVTVTTPPGPSLNLPFGPVQSIESVTYLADTGNLDTAGDPMFADTTFVDSNGDPLYELDVFPVPNRLVLKYGESWPSARASLNSVRVRYVTGYVPAPDTPGNAVLPKMARSAILLMLEHLYVNRGAANVEMPASVMALLDLTPDGENLWMA